MDEEKSLRKGPWSVEEDLLLMNYVGTHGEGHWNSLARSAGLRRTGKSCRLRWLNYLRPDVRRGNITAEEQLLILELHSRWGNRWSKIAQYLPGRTDNEIKNYWRTRVQKHAKQLRCDVSSQRFKDVVRHLWMPRLVERIRAGSSSSSSSSSSTAAAAAAAATNGQDFTSQQLPPPPPSAAENSDTAGQCSREEYFSESSDCCFAADTVRSSSSDDGGGGWFQEAAELSGGGGWWPEGALEPSPGLGGELGPLGWEESSWSMEDIWLQVEL